MAEKGLKIPIVSYDDLRVVASEFLDREHPDGTLPVPIEKIIDIHLGMNITLLPSLQSICGVDAFINTRCDTIYVDGGIYLSPNLNRYRFSLAHELAHSIIHRDVIAQLKYETMGQWKDARKSISAQDNGWLEWQAHALAGLILVPQPKLQDRHRAKTQQIMNIRDGEGMSDFDRSGIEQSLAIEFQVSVDVIQRRCVKDNLGVA